MLFNIKPSWIRAPLTTLSAFEFQSICMNIRNVSIHQKDTFRNTIGSNMSFGTWYARVFLPFVIILHQQVHERENGVIHTSALTSLSYQALLLIYCWYLLNRKLGFFESQFTKTKIQIPWNWDAWSTLFQHNPRGTCSCFCKALDHENQRPGSVRSGN